MSALNPFRTGSRRAAATLAILLTIGAGSGCRDDRVTTGREPNRSAGDSDRSQGVLDGHIDNDEPGCAASVGIQGDVVWTGVRGIANLTTGTPIGPQTVFDIASVSKQFTATAILLLAQEGKLALDNPLSDYVAGLPPWAATVTVGQLIHQTSGIPDYGELLAAAGYEDHDRTTQSQALQELAAVPRLEFTPGSRFEYSNSNYLLLGEIVQRASGTPLPHFLSEEIFQPLGLAMVMDPVGTIPNRAVSYEKGAAGYTVADSAWEQVGDGSVQTTPSELVRWADNYRTGQLGGPGLLDAQLDGAVETDEGSGERYGAGIGVLADGTLEHDGGWAGFVATFRVSKDRRTSLAIACNTADHDIDAIADALWQLWT
ncbi:MAG: beta-lactamase family protein [Mycobacterium sp.]|nr:beta-lactamase family protein [Mycobacterium sp.]